MKPLLGKNSLWGTRGLILLLGFSTFVCGFISVFLSIVNRMGSGYNGGDRYYAILFAPLGVSFYGMGILSRPYVSLAFYFLLLVGSVLFAVNRKEVKLIRFAAAVLLWDRVLGLCSLIVSVFWVKGEERFWVGKHSEVLPVYVLPFLWLGAAIWLLRLTGERMQLDVRKGMGELGGEFVHSSKWMRLLHLVFDLVVCWLVFFDQGPVFGPEVWYRLVSELGVKGALLFYLLVFRMGYYVFFEAICGATPGKYLTGARVADFYGERVGIGKVLVRTLGRLVPFDAVTFLIGEGWHDRWSRTFVLRETGEVEEVIEEEPMPFAGQPQRPGLIGASFEGS